jgi:hypothetical protein
MCVDENRRMWEKYIMDTFVMRKGEGEASEYILLRSEQLVGTALILVIKAELTKAVRSVESATKKVVRSYVFLEWRN